MQNPIMMKKNKKKYYLRNIKFQIKPLKILNQITDCLII